MHLISLIQQKIELFRLEQRYTRRRNKRSTFVSEAQYVDGEYIYSPTSSSSSSPTKPHSAGNNSDSEEPSYAQQAQSPTSSTSTSTSSSSAGSKGGSIGRAGKRMSMMGLEKMDWRKGKGNSGEKETRRNTLVVREREVVWNDSVRSVRR